MLRTQTFMKNVWVPPPPRPTGHFKLVKEIVTIDLATGHRHVESTEDWTPRDDLPREEITAANKILAMHPPHEFTGLVSSIDETPEMYYNRTVGRVAGAMDVSSAVEQPAPETLPPPPPPQPSTSEEEHEPDETTEDEGGDTGQDDGQGRRRKRR